MRSKLNWKNNIWILKQCWFSPHYKKCWMTVFVIRKPIYIEFILILRESRRLFENVTLPLLVADANHLRWSFFATPLRSNDGLKRDGWDEPWAQKASKLYKQYNLQTARVICYLSNVLFWYQDVCESHWELRENIRNQTFSAEE